MKIGEIIKELRTERGLSQAALAKEIGVSQKAVDYWERGINEPKASYIVALAEFFGVSSDELLGRKWARRRERPRLFFTAGSKNSAAARILRAPYGAPPHFVSRPASGHAKRTPQAARAEKSPAPERCFWAGGLFFYKVV